MKEEDQTLKDEPVNETSGLGEEKIEETNATLADSPATEQNTNDKKRKLERGLQIVVNVALVVIVGVVAFLAWIRLTGRTNPLVAETTAQETSSEQLPTDTPVEDVSVSLKPFAGGGSFNDGVYRVASLHTTIPTRPRSNVITYTVQAGDSLFSIADTYGLKPETLLWGNFDVLQDNPHLLKPGQVLNILPVDGTYYRWQEGDDLRKVASFFKVDPEDILEYPGNRFDLTEASVDEPNIKEGTWLIIPGGKRAVQDWGPPAISRANPATARYYGPGFCGAIYQGAIGSGAFIWPTTSHWLSGYDYNAVVHPAIDIGGEIGTPIYAADAGVVVYAGWSNWGYGNLIVIDHGNGWQTAYAHLSSIAVGCGQSVFQGTQIGGMGSTGNSSGPHLHFEMVYNGAKLNPHDFLP